jgi:hypothetical protein
VAFPESHDTPRLAMTLGDPAPAELTRQYRFHYLFAATFSICSRSRAACAAAAN